jgi:hypothetical protein
MTELAALHPEIEGLLREVAADPQSNLLRLPRTGLRHSLRRAELPERAPTTGLRPAERELLRTCRHEVAYLLLLACYRQQITAPQNRYLVYSLNESGEVAATLERRWLALASQKLGLMSGRSILNAMALLARCVSPDGHRWPSVLELAAASSRLDPSNTAHNYAALELILAHQPASGVRMLEKSRLRALHLPAMHLVNLAFGYERMGDFEKAHDVLVGLEWPWNGQLTKCFMGLTLSAQRNQEAQAARWAWELNELVVGGGDIRPHVEGLKHRRRAGHWRPEPTAPRVLSQVARKVGGCIEEVAHGFA